MEHLRILRGQKTNLPLTGVDSNSLYFTEDTRELFKSIGNGQPLAKYSDVIFVDALPNSNQIQGKIYVLITKGTLHSFNGTAWMQIGGLPIQFTPTSVDTLENKTIDATKNTISNLQVTNFTTGVIDTDNKLGGISASDTKISSQKAVYDFVNAKIAGLAGDLNYSGALDCSVLGSQLDNKKKGQFFKVSKAGMILGLEFAVGDMVIVNEDIIGTPIDATHLDKIDNTESADILRISNISTNIDLAQDANKIADRATIKTAIENYLTWGTF